MAQRADDIVGRARCQLALVTSEIVAAASGDEPCGIRLKELPRQPGEGLLGVRVVATVKQSKYALSSVVRWQSRKAIERKRRVGSAG
jgi:hypothetical protein